MDIQSLLGEEAESLLTHTCKGVTKEDLDPPGPGLHRSGVVADRPAPAGAAQPRRRCTNTAASPAPGTSRSSRSTRASSIRRRRRSPRTRSTSTRPTSAGWRSKAAATRWPRTFGVLAAVSRQFAHKIPFIVKINHNELMTYPNKFDQIMFGSVQAGLRPRRRRRRRHDLLRLGPGDPADPGGVGRLPRGPRTRHVHRAVVLPAQQRLQEGRRRLPRVGRPHRPGQPHRRHHRGRHHQAEAAREQRRLQRARLELRQDAARSSTSSSPPTTRST